MKDFYRLLTEYKIVTAVINKLSVYMRIDRLDTSEGR